MSIWDRIGRSLFVAAAVGLAWGIRGDFRQYAIPRPDFGFANNSGWMRQSEITGVESSKLQLERISCDGRWDSPALDLAKLHVDLYQKQLEVQAQLDVATRELRSQGRFDFDVHQLEPLLSTNAQDWLRRYEWVAPPLVEASARVVQIPGMPDFPAGQGYVAFMTDVLGRLGAIP